MEIVIVIGLLGILVVAALSAVTLLDKSARRQALHTTALEMAQSRIEELQATTYNPPTAPFTAATNTSSTTVALCMNKAGASNEVFGTMTTDIQPASAGHLVTVTVRATNAGQPMEAQLQTLINRKSGGQP